MKIGRDRRGADRAALGWALLVSAILTQLLLIPAAYLLLKRRPLRAEPQAVEVTLLDEVPAPPAPTPKSPPVRRQPDRRSRTAEPLPKTHQLKEAVAKPQPIQPSRQRLKMVEVQNPESETPPDQARFLSDKNRRVDRETRARVTNLQRQEERQQPAPSKRAAQQAGSPKPRVAEHRIQPAPTKRNQPRKIRRSSLLEMRWPALAAHTNTPRRTAVAAHGRLPTPVRATPRRRVALRLQIDHRDFDRIYGSAAARSRELARLHPSAPSGGKTRRKWQRVLAALENFVPEVQPGNQTALGTRADPFAVYIARMHRSIHKLWGYGFLVDLAGQTESSPLNDMTLWTVVEIAVKPSGEVRKATVVRPSGMLAFDTAALDTVFTAAPYPSTPSAIRSTDGNVYLHWRFHRDHRQCGTFGVDPYILTKPPTGPIDTNVEEIGSQDASRSPTVHRSVRHLNRPIGSSFSAAPAVGTPPARSGTPQQPSAMAAAADRRVSADDAAARAAAARFVEAFERGDANAMAAACGFPFLAYGSRVARNRDQLGPAFENLIAEATSRHVSSVELMTVMQARKRLERLPPGARYGDPMLVGRVNLGGTPTTLLLERRNGTWKVVGLNR